MNLKAIIYEEDKSAAWKAEQCLLELAVAEGSSRAELLAAAQIFAIIDLTNVVEKS